MSDTPGGPGWWMADDGKWYSPERRVGDSTAAPTASAEPTTSPDAPTGARRQVGVIAAVAAAVVLAGVVAALVFLTGGDDIAGDADPGDGEVIRSPDEGEVFLEPADEVGDNAFTDVAFVVTPEVELEVEVPDSGDDTIGSLVGSTPGLYGGTRDEGWCDSGAVAGFLDDHPDHANAFVDALAADPSWRSGDSPAVGPDELGGYLGTLTPVLLTADTRVTNHGYRDGAPLPFQAVLQTGTAVLADTDGVPRVRCACGNPLTAPDEPLGTVTYTGTRWTAFDVTRLVLIQPAPEPVEVFVLVDVITGDRFERPGGTTGDADTPVGGAEPDPAPTTRPPTTRPPTTAPPTTAPPTTVPATTQPPTTQPPTTQPPQVGAEDTSGNWGATATRYRDRVGQRISFRCAAGGEERIVWGTDVYTDDSSVCTAAVHAGAIRLGEGATVLVEIRPGQQSYAGSERNGVRTQNWGSWPGSFVVVGRA